MNASHGDSATPNLRKLLEVAAKYSGLYPFAFFFGGGASALPSLQGRDMGDATQRWAKVGYLYILGSYADILLFGWLYITRNVY